MAYSLFVDCPLRAVKKSSLPGDLEIKDLLFVKVGSLSTRSDVHSWRLVIPYKNSAFPYQWRRFNMKGLPWELSQLYHVHT